MSYLSWQAWQRRLEQLTLAAIAAVFFGAGLALAADSWAAALHTPLRDALDREFGAFRLETLGPVGRHDPVAIRARLLEDASQNGPATTLRARVLALRMRQQWRETSGDVTLSVGGAAAGRHVRDWLAGREVEAPVAFRRPTRYLNEGVSDFERDLALGGTTLFGSVKSGLLVEVRARGTPVQEAAARVRRMCGAASDAGWRLMTPSLQPSSLRC